MSTEAPHVLIIDARFYDDIADELVAGASQELEAAGARVSRVSVPGVLEIPAAMAMARAQVQKGAADYDAYVLLGCVIRGETSHYDIVANGAIVGVTLFAMVALFGAAGYLVKRVYYDKKYFTPAFEQ